MPVRGGLVRQRLGHAPRPRSLLLPVVAGASVGLLALLLTAGTWRAAVIGSFIAAVIGLSLVVVTGYAGQVSLAQLALAGTAAFALSGLTESWGVPFPFAPLLAALVATVIGVVVGLPALRLRGLTLGVVTLALAYAIEAVWFRNADIVPSSGAHVTPPSLFGLDLGIGAGRDFPRIEFGLLCLVTLVAVALGVAMLRRSTLGSAMLAVRANERSAAAAGVSVVRVKVLSFALASFIAGLGGSLLAYRRGVVTFDSFTALGGLALLSTAYLAGVTSVWGGINAGILASSGIVFIALDRWVDLGDWFQVITGLLLIATLIAHPEGIASLGHKLADRMSRWRGRRGATDTGAAAPVVATAGSPATDIERPVVTAGAAPVVAGAGRAAGRAPHGPLRRCRSRRRRVATCRQWHGRRAHRPERGRQDQRHRRHHWLRPGRGRHRAGRPSHRRTGDTRPGAGRPGPHLPAARALRRPLRRGERQRGRQRPPSFRARRRGGTSARWASGSTRCVIDRRAS